ncbi:MAG TPA: PAS domain S-box protein [Anaerolineales bacterium]|nr:PAS domain S-box protein [Anaerolineales bacterium]
MQNDLAGKEREIQSLHQQVADLQRQLGEAQAAIQALTAPSGDTMQVEAAQQRAEELNAVIQTLHDPVMVYDQNGVIYMANASAMRAHGFDPTRHHRRDTNETLLIRYSDGKIAHSDDLPSARALKGETVIDEPLTIINSEGQELNILVTSSPLIVNGIQRGAVSVWHDITERKRIEDARRESEANYRNLVETAFEGIWVVDIKGRTSFVNHRMAQMLKYDSPNDLLNRSAFDFVPEEDLEELRANFLTRLNKNSSVHYDVRLRCRDGSLIWASVASNNLLDVNGNIIGRMALFMDITERKQVEERLRAARDEAAWLARLPGENPSPVLRVSNEGIVLYCNPPAASLRGWRCVVHEPLSRPLRDLVELAVTQGQAVEQDVSIGDKFYWVSVIPFPNEGYLNLYGRDVTERKQAEKALAESERRQREITRLLELDQARLAAILQHLPVGVWIADQHGRLIGSNKQADQIWAGEAPLVNSPAEYQRYVSWDPGSGRQLQPEEYPVAVALRTASPVNPMELKIRRFDGSGGTVLASAAPIKDNRGELMGVVGVNVDITERKQMEEALRESEHRYHSLFEMMQEGLVAAEIITDEHGNPIDYRYLDVNPATERQFGTPRDQFIGRTYTEVLPEGDPEWIDIFGKVALTGQPVSVERYGKATKKWFECHVYSPRPRQVVNILTDITERKQFEIALRKRESILAQAGEMAHLGAWDIEIENPDDLNVNLLTWSDEVYRIFGYAPGEVTPSNDLFFEHVHPDDRALVQEGVAHAIATKQPYTLEHRIRRSDGEERVVQEHAEIFFDESGKPTRIVGAVQDITERKQVEEAMRESEVRLKRAQEIAHLGSWELDLVNDRLTWSDEVYRIFGLQPQEFKATYEAFLDAVHPEDRAAVDAAYTESIQEGKDSYEIEHRVVKRSNGEVRIVHEKCEHFRNQDGQIVRSIGMVHDITDRKKVEEALREAEIKYRTLVENIPNAVTYMDSLDPAIGTFYVSPQIETMLGYTVKEWQDNPRSWHEHLHPQDRDRLLSSDFQHEVSGEPFSLEYRLIARDGRTVWVRDEAVMIRDSSGKPQFSQGIMIDITERKKAEEALRESEERFSKAFHSSPDAIIISRMSDGLIIEVNEGWRALFGHEPSEVVGRTSSELDLFVNPDDRKEAVRRLKETGVIRDFELQIRRQSGEVRLASLSAERMEVNGEAALLTVLRDITERKQGEKALRESEERFRSLADSMPQLVWTALPDGTVDYYNSRSQEYREIKQVEGAAWEWAPVLYPDDLQPTVAAWQHALQTGETYQIEHRVCMMDGSYRWHLSRGVPARAENGEIVRWYGTATDIHDLKMAEEQLKVYAERLERSNRELEQFAFMASHDLQEPLRKIEMFGDLLLERAAELNDSERNYLDRMRNAAGRMREMVEGLLQLSRVTTQAKTFVPVDLSQVAVEVLHDLEGQLRRTGGAVEVHSLPVVEGDRSQLHQLIQNLIGNALKYHQPDSRPDVKVYAEELSGKARLYVQDQGIGFDQEDTERIFQPFQRLVGRSQYEGSGIGLAICRRIVERHNGEIAARSQPGQGTTFIVTLPIHHAERASSDS